MDIEIEGFSRSNNSEVKNDSKPIKIEEMKDVDIELESLHHSIDIKDETSTSDSQFDIDFKLQSIIYEKTHTSGKPYKCAVCDYRCLYKYILQKHLRIHTGEKPFECTVCDYKCSEKERLPRHFRTYTGEKPYECTVCGYKCSEKHNLQRHLQTHIDKKSYRCLVCNYKCSDKNRLQTHLRTHAGEKPHE